MTLKQLEAFYWAVKLGSFAIAAQRLNMTQSSLSKRIAELEYSVGKPLFDRSGKKALPTEAGLSLVEIANKMLQLTDEISSLGQPEGSLTGTCNFGASELTALTWLPSMLEHVGARHPGLVVEPYVDLATVLERRVARGELDFAIAPGPGVASGISRKKVQTVEFWWTCAPAVAPADNLITLDVLRSMPIITMTGESGLTRAFHAWCVLNNLNVRHKIACNNLMTIIGLTIAGLGLSYLPAAFTKPLVDRGLLLPLNSDPPFPAQDYHFLAREDDRRSLIAEMRIIVQEAADFSKPYGQWHPLM
jgi:DNA-binding transcriptional LysR family regulator